MSNYALNSKVWYYCSNDNTNYLAVICAILDKNTYLIGFKENDPCPVIVFNPNSIKGGVVSRVAKSLGHEVKEIIPEEDWMKYSAARYVGEVFLSSDTDFNFLVHQINQELNSQQ